MPTPEQTATLEAQIAQWREFLRRRQAIHAVDVAELEDHLRELVAALWGDAVVLPLAAVLGDDPARLDVAQAFEAVEDGVEHAVGPLHVAAGEFTDALQDRIPVAVVLGEDREHDRRGRGGDQVLVELHVAGRLRGADTLQYYT